MAEGQGFRNSGAYRSSALAKVLPWTSSAEASTVQAILDDYIYETGRKVDDKAFNALHLTPGNLSWGVELHNPPTTGHSPMG